MIPFSPPDRLGMDELGPVGLRSSVLIALQKGIRQPSQDDSSSPLQSTIEEQSDSTNPNQTDSKTLDGTAEVEEVGNKPHEDEAVTTPVKERDSTEILEKEKSIEAEGKVEDEEHGKERRGDETSAVKEGVSTTPPEEVSTRGESSTESGDSSTAASRSSILLQATMWKEWLRACTDGDQAEIHRLLSIDASLLHFVAPHSHGLTALHILARGGHHRLIRALHSQGADLNAKTETGRTPLHLAAEAGQSRTAQELLSLGANPDVFDACGYFWKYALGSTKDAQMIMKDAVKEYEELDMEKSEDEDEENDGKESIYVQRKSMRSKSFHEQENVRILPKKAVGKTKRSNSLRFQTIARINPFQNSKTSSMDSIPEH